MTDQAVLFKQAANLADDLNKPVYIVSNDKGEQSVTEYFPNSLEWKKRKFTWISTVSPRRF